MWLEWSPDEVTEASAQSTEAQGSRVRAGALSLPWVFLVGGCSPTPLHTRKDYVAWQQERPASSNEHRHTAAVTGPDRTQTQTVLQASQKGHSRSPCMCQGFAWRLSSVPQVSFPTLLCRWELFSHHRYGIRGSGSSVTCQKVAQLGGRAEV